MRLEKQGQEPCLVVDPNINTRVLVEKREGQTCFVSNTENGEVLVVFGEDPQISGLTRKEALVLLGISDILPLDKIV